MKLLIFEDEAGIRESLVDYFETQDFQVTAVANLADAHLAMEEERFDVVILDLLLPDGDGIDFLIQRRQAKDDVTVIIVTARGEEEQRIAGLRAGADDYVVKPFSVVELEARVLAIARRRPQCATLELEDAEVDIQAFTITRSGKQTRLLQKEAELLAYLSQHPGIAIKGTDLLKQVWGYEAAPTTRTVDTHIFKLRQKLEVVPDAPRHLVTVHGVGYRFDP